MTVQKPLLDQETKNIIEEALSRFVDGSYDAVTRRARLNGVAVDYRAHWGALATLGVLGLQVGEEFGGIGGGALDVSDALRVLARGLVLEPLIECAVIAAAVLRHGDDASETLPALIAGTTVFALVGGRRGDSLKLERGSDGFNVSGVARVVPGASSADVWLVAAKDESSKWHLLRVAPDTSGIRSSTYRMMDGRGASDIDFGSAILERSALWLEGDAAERALADAAANAVSAYCADAVGSMQTLVLTTRDYLRTREQFGALLSSFQVLQHRFADMHIAALESCSISRSIARHIDASDRQEIAWLCYAAPSVVARCAERVGHEAIQMHGGMGVTDELMVSHYNSRLVVANKLLERWAAVPSPRILTN
jgi:alkylation response protein AidB-like acyl-CoA dehydrogenase